VSSYRLSQSYASFVSQLSSISIPSNIQEALADPRWTKAMVDEMAALEKNNTWDLVSLPRGKKLWAANGYLQLSIELMKLLRCIKHDLWLKVTLNLMV